MKPYYERGGVTIYLGDCRDILPTLEAGSVDLVLTDPPYGVEIAEWDNRTPHELLPEFLRISSAGVLWFGAAGQIALDVRSFPESPDRVLIWAPKFTLSHTMKDGLAYRWQPIYAWRLPHKHSGPTWDVLQDSTECGNWWKHSCTKPLSLITRLAGFSQDTILDPFMGSGTTLRAAKNLGCRAIGIEINEAYAEVAAKRLMQDTLPLFAPPAEVG